MGMKNDREYRDMTLMVVEDEKKVRGYATTFNEPYVIWDDGEVRILEEVAPEAFNDTDTRDVIFQYNHEGRVMARVSNGTLSVSPDDHGLLVDADLSGTELGRQLYEEIRGGYTNKMSFGFTIAAEEQIRHEDTGAKPIEVTRRIKKVGKLYDVSAVAVPANPGTVISARTKEYCDGVITKLAEECREREAAEHREKQRDELSRLLKEVMRDE